MDIGLSPMTQWSMRGYYGKYDESSALDILSQPGEVNDTANLNQRLYRFDSSVSQVIGSRQLLQGGVEWTQDQYRGYNRVLGDNAGQEISMVDLWISDRISVHNRLSVTLGGRFNNHSRYGKHFVPRASALFRVTDSLRLRGAVGRGFRSPDLGQLYFRFQNPTHFYQVIGNTHLEPEESTTYQVGFDYNPSKFRFAVNFFRNDIQDLIQAEYLGFPTSPQAMAELLQSFRIDPVFNPSLFRAFYHYQNVQDVYTAGIESRVELRLTRNLLLSSGYTYLDARDKETATTATFGSFTAPTGWEDYEPTCVGPISANGPSPDVAAARSAIPTRYGTGIWPSRSSAESNCSLRSTTCSTVRIRG